jgi:hypothetical protein
MNSREQFECANCYHIGPLNSHGGCEQCWSSAVVSLDRIEVVSVRTGSPLSKRTVSERAVPA